MMSYRMKYLWDNFHVFQFISLYDRQQKCTLTFTNHYINLKSKYYRENKMRCFSLCLILTRQIQSAVLYVFLTLI